MEERNREIKEQDNTATLTRTKHQLSQFNQIKKVLVNFGFVDRGKRILSTEICVNIMQEMRQERKIRMALQDKVDEYIHMDLSGIKEETEVDE